MKNPVFQEHVLRVNGGLDIIIGNLRDMNGLSEFAKTLGGRHYKYGVLPEYFKVYLFRKPRKDGNKFS